jgi:hypothetical protein
MGDKPLCGDALTTVEDALIYEQKGPGMPNEKELTAKRNINLFDELIDFVNLFEDEPEPEPIEAWEKYL